MVLIHISFGKRMLPIILNEYFIPKHFSYIKMLIVDNFDII